MKPAGIQVFPSATALAAALLLACVSGGSAIAASSSAKCPDTISDSEILNVEVDALNIRVVEHFQTENVSNETTSPEVTEQDVEAASPLLTLAPRVVLMLDRVFSDALELQESNTESEAVSPVAGAEDSATDLAPINSDIVEEFEILDLQRRMYRKDI